ncbi:MAG: peptide chain release factor N(5)-glutamine methyltransferase [Bacteroidota bacterium]
MNATKPSGHGYKSMGKSSSLWMLESKNLFDYLVGQLLSVYEVEEARSIIFLLVENKLGLRKIDVLANKSINNPEPIAFLHPFVERLKQHEPIQYVLGETAFFGRQFFINPHVLIPRPETEELVDIILKDYRLSDKLSQGLNSILDIGTGSGCIAVTLAKEIPQATVHAWDISTDALAVAQKNAEFLQTKVQFDQINILQPQLLNRDLPFDLVVSNPPYVTRAEIVHMRRNVTDYEPQLALFVENDSPLVFYESIAAFCQTNLREQGACYVEINEQYALEVMRLFRDKGFIYTEILEDLFGKERFVKAIR